MSLSLFGLYCAAVSVGGIVVGVLVDDSSNCNNVLFVRHTNLPHILIFFLDRKHFTKLTGTECRGACTGKTPST
jgi:hypothetical protein